MVGIPALVARKIKLVAGNVALVELAFTVQFVLGAASAKMRPPMVRTLSSASVVVPVRSSVLKSAVKSVPPAMTPFFQLVATPQLPEALPLLMRLVHVPFCARELVAPKNRAAARTSRLAVILYWVFIGFVF